MRLARALLLLPMVGAVVAGVAYWMAGGRPAANAPHPTSVERMAPMVERLAGKLEQAPQDGAAWATLARSYAALGRFEDADAAFARAEKLLPADAQLLADYADVAAVLQGKRLQGRPEALIARALAAEPRNLKALYLSGTLMLERGQYAAAAQQWRRMLALVPPESSAGRAARRGIAEAERRAAAGN